MMNFLLYLIKVSINIGLIYAFYFLLLRKLTFYGLNRLVLMSGLLVSILLPLFTFHFHYNPGILDLPQGKNFITHSSTVIQRFTKPDTLQTLGNRIQTNPFILVWSLGFIFFFLRFLISFSALVRGIQRAVPYTIEGKSFLVSKKYNSPFSFFHYCFIPEKMMDSSAVHSIIHHERIHGEQKHSMDILFVEIVSLFLWFNPIIYFYKRSIRTQHEYYVDRETVQRGLNIDVYLKNLCSVSIPTAFPLTNQFSFHSLKTRIIMVTSMPSAPFARFRYLSLLFLGGVLFFFNSCSFEQEDLPKPAMKQQPAEIAFADVPSVSPLEESKIGYQTGYGMRIHPIYKIKRMHVGHDFSAPTGTEIYATANGQITDVQEKYNGYGNMVTITHGDYVTRYAHMDKIYVKLHEKVIKGEVIGTVGSSGLSTCPHLHYEVLFKGNYVDPAKYLPSMFESVSFSKPQQTWD